MKKSLASLLALGAAASCAPEQDQPAPNAPAPSADAAGDPSKGNDGAAPNVMGTIPAGVYQLDPSHSTLAFEVSHLGFSSFVGMFDDFDAMLTLDPGDPGQSQIEATIELASLDIPSPPDGFVDDLLGPDWLNAGEQARMTFRSTRVEPTGEYAARVTGDLQLNGVTAPVTMDVVFNGGWEGIPPDPNARVGFSATGSLNRSSFNVSTGIPEPGTNMGVSDAVEFRVETEFSGPPMEAAPADQPADATQQ